VVDENAPMDTIPRWFEGLKLNFAENMLFRRNEEAASSTQGVEGKEDSKVAITEIREGGTEVRHITWGQLRKQVGRLANAMRAHGVTKGDRIAVVASNSFDTLTIFLACTAVGGIFSSSSTDMGTKGILDRLCQIEPKVNGER
jgi:acetoacetyl-CoA synthetase